MGNTRPKRTLQEEVENIIGRVFKNFYFGKERNSIKTVHEMICHEIKMVNETKKLSYELACPSYSAVYSRVKKAEKNIPLNQQKNKKNESEKMEYPKRALQRVKVFSGRLGLDAVEDETKVSQREVEMIIDNMIKQSFKRREKIGVSNVLEAVIQEVDRRNKDEQRLPSDELRYPSMSIISSRIKEKSLHEVTKVKHRKKVAFDKFGIVNMQVDNGSGFNRSWFKGSIERFFKTLNTNFLHRLPGTAFSNVVTAISKERENILLYKQCGQSGTELDSPIRVQETDKRY
jgi:putative transposase